MTFNKPLYDAAKAGELAQCEALILKNADVNWKNRDVVVYFTAWRKLCMRYVKTNKFAMCNLVQPYSLIYHHSRSLLPILHVRSLIFYSFELNAGFDSQFYFKGDSSAIHLAADYGHPYVIRLLVSHGAELNATDEVFWL